MKAMVINKLVDLKECSTPLSLVDMPRPVPAVDEVLIKVLCCAVCHTELDEIEGRTPPPSYPMIPGHQVVGIVEELGRHVSRIALGERVGVAWIFDSCGHCDYCCSQNENLCEDFVATGRDVHGGYAQYMVAKASCIFPIPAEFNSAQAAPLLCAGAIGYRSLRLANLKDGNPLGLTGFGASAHLVLKMCKHQYPNSDIYVFARSEEERAFALELGAVWAGDSTDSCPHKLSAIIDTTPAWLPIVAALENLRAAGRLVINAIRKEERDKKALLELNYPAHLWLEKELKSVANVSKRDVAEFLQLAAQISIKPVFQEFPLERANKALIELKNGKIKGAKVLRVQEE